MSTLSFPIAPNLSRFFSRSERAQSDPAADLDALLDRIRRRLYRDTVLVLTSLWLKTVLCAGHNRAWWGELDTAIAKVLSNESLDATAAEAIRDIQAWIRQKILPRHKAPEAQTLLAPPFRPDMTPGQAAPYLCRVLNGWLPGEVARQLTTEAGFAGSDEGGMPAMAIAKALERLLLCEHVSPASLELLLQTDWFSPKYAYPAHVEIFRDVVLGLLGRTAAPLLPVLPATALAGGFADAVGRAVLVSTADGDELQVPLTEPQALEIFRHDPVRVGSIVVTMDGRCWQSFGVQKGPETVIVYRPAKRLRIDFTSEHAALVLPWPDAEPRWPGAVHLPGQVALFGREWRSRAWERIADQTWLHLEFSGVLEVPETLDPDNSRPRHLRPASVEMAWSEVERTLATGVPDSMARLRHEDLLPLAHALERLVDYLVQPWPPARAKVERAVASVRYLHGAVARVYGRIPWRVLPAPARTALLKRRGDAAFAHLFTEIFDDAPASARTWPPRAA